jgi:tetratricopeptide (TPR) repeat protein
VAAARRAAWLVDTGVAGAALRQRVQSRRADLELLAELEDARLQMTAGKEGQFGFELHDRLMAETFQRAGLDVEALSAEEAAESIRASSVAAEVAGALDYWALIRRKIRGSADPSWRHLLRVALEADPDAWRDRVRDALGRWDKQALRELARSAEVSRQPLLTLDVLGAALLSVGAVEPAEALLRQARQAHPGDFWINHDLGEALEKAQPPRWDEALRFYTAASALRPQSAGAHLNVGHALDRQGQVDEAIAEYREALRLKTDYPEPHNNLGNALRAKGQVDEAIAEYREALRLKKDYPAAHNNLGIVLEHKGQLDEAIAEYREALRLKKDYPEAHNHLGSLLREKGQLDEAIAEHREALRLKKEFPEAHNNLGNALCVKGQLDEAIAEYREALRINKYDAAAHDSLGNALCKKGQLDEAIAEHREALRINKYDAAAHNNLGNALRSKGQLDEAIAAYRKAIRLKKEDPCTHFNLGNALRDMGQLDEAIAAYREAIRIHMNYPMAHCRLGHVLLQQGRFADALAALKRGHELGSKIPRWSVPSAQWVRETEQLLRLESMLPKLLQGEAQPANAAERIMVARLCGAHKKRYAAATRFYAEAFAAQPKLAEDVEADNRYNAACAAALAGCGMGEDAGKLDAKERTRLHRQAHTWLRADLAQYAQLVEKGPEPGRAAVQQRLQHWQKDPDFAGVRGDALAKLPEAERREWQKLWAEVEALRQRAMKPAAP